MKTRTSGLLVLLPLLALGVGPACNKQEPATPKKKPDSSAAPPAQKADPVAGHDPSRPSASESPHSAAPKPSPRPPEAPAAPPTSATGTGALTLEGIQLTVPSGWLSEPVPPGPMAPVAVYRLPTPDGGFDDVSVRITYFPNMKGMDDANIDRWIAQVTLPDGRKAARADAKIETTQLGPVRVTIVDISGTISAGPGMPGTGTKADQRAINAVIDHPKGPHFLRAAGTKAAMDHSADAIRACILSAKLAG